MIAGNDTLNDPEDIASLKDTDGMIAVDLHLDDDLPQPSVPTKLSFINNPNVNDPPAPSHYLESQIEIVIKQFEKKGEGMNAYIVYKVATITQNMQGYIDREYVVWRRFSDFLGLHEKLVDKYFYKGYLVPAAPEKSIAALTRTKMNTSVDDNTNEFAERRARGLQRFCRRIARHPKLVFDCDFRDFLTMTASLPKANSTVALSGAGVKRMFKTVGDVFSKMAFHMDENDRWFEAAQQQMEDMEQNLGKLLRAVESLSSYRRELISGTDSFSKALSMLSSCEENTSLARCLSHLTETYENIDQLHGMQSDKDCALLAEGINEQLQVICTLKELFFERVKIWQNWQGAQQNLTRKREMKARHELSGRTDKANQIVDEINSVCFSSCMIVICEWVSLFLQFL
ncbi:PX domain-containing protein, variant [Loa loa]|uniref:PX domain-containing protein, variant n=1 Tax=Loa loa TaxID=7209 RepID=A0A1S0ULD6_LOALO|nr:PX domain-containing protein, variant [Loa loa]EJD75657.1 PX domain-containing protein, variant [Loa loa]